LSNGYRHHRRIADHVRIWNCRKPAVSPEVHLW
jgi:hypothetical protein